ncbi:MAG: UDP-N-acetylmuramoyl-L-alanine--D-glutamate ligase [Proteobacteria bacterium]|nr:UDP-N-acetylmuramoyl-L-alanine--D-glutamate ligase [Pseudomonadota bacterium]
MIVVEEFRGKNVAVFGLGKAGNAAVKALLNSGANVFAWDDGEAGRNSLLAQDYGKKVTLAEPKTYDWKSIAALVLSPGVPFTHPAPNPIVKLAQGAKVPIICDVELLYRASPQSTFIGITGTNGKSTTTALIGHIMKTAGRDTEVGGNIGIAASELRTLGKGGVYVIELSSYQLDLLSKMRCNVAVFLNITPDHLDRHGDIPGYIKAKMHIFDRQQKSDTAVIAVDDDHTRTIAKDLKAKGAQQVIEVSSAQSLKQGISVRNKTLSIALPNEKKDIALGDLIHLKGDHNAQNIAAATAAALAVGVDAATIEKAIQSFVGLPHRAQFVAEKNGVLFINDSKATNAEATEKALLAYDNIYWILGGQQKAGGITMLEPLFKKIHHAFLIGEAADAFAKTLDGKVKYTKVGTLEKAVAEANAMAAKDTSGKKPVVLLSPACASWDQFKSYEDRGAQFCAHVGNITSAGAKSA